MKAINQTTFLQLKNAQFWLIAITAALIAIHLTLAWRGNPSLLGTSFLFWAAISSLIWEKRYSLRMESGIIPSFLGLLLLGLVLIKSASMTSLGGFLYVFPFVSGLGLALLASGFTGLMQYRGELLALFFIAVPKLIPTWVLDITPFTAKLAAFMLWYTGAEVIRSGVHIHLPTGSVLVASGCSGIELIFQILGLGILFLLMFPLSWYKKILVLLVGGIVAFVVNGARVVVMTVIVGKGEQEAFEYWHNGDGSLIFSMIAVFIFGLFCWFILEQSQLEKGTRSL
jgi:cyanoexosortase A